MNIISLASGAGLWDWAWRDAGATIKLQCENNEIANLILHKAFPETQHDNHISRINCYLPAFFGNIELQKIDSRLIANFYAHLSKKIFQLRPFIKSTPLLTIPSKKLFVTVSLPLIQLSELSCPKFIRRKNLHSLIRKLKESFKPLKFTATIPRPKT